MFVLNGMYCILGATTSTLGGVQPPNAGPASAIPAVYLVCLTVGRATFAQPYIFSVVNCGDVALSVFNSLVLTRCGYFCIYQLLYLSVECCVSSTSPNLGRWKFMFGTVTIFTTTSKESACRTMHVVSTNFETLKTIWPSSAY